MTEIERILTANAAYAAGGPALPPDARPSRGVAVVTCMDARLDVLATLGLEVGDAHVIRNAGGRVSDDALRSLAISVQLLGVETVVVMQHTKCGLAGTTDDALRARTGADVAFLAIDDHAAALRRDVDVVAATPYLTPVVAVAGLLYDVATGAVEDVYRWQRP
ncbi:MAG TPA: carbonic anhydrase [Frankiaceae bacterium]|nr:carbonic anhydrase [Frankiaceae bacterium]